MNLSSPTFQRQYLYAAAKATETMLPQTVFKSEDPYEPFISGYFGWTHNSENHRNAQPLVTVLPANYLT